MAAPPPAQTAVDVNDVTDKPEMTAANHHHHQQQQQQSVVLPPYQQDSGVTATKSSV